MCVCACVCECGIESTAPFVLHCFICDNNIFVVNSTTFKKKMNQPQRSRKGEGERTVLPAFFSPGSVTAIADTCLKSENSAKHSDISKQPLCRGHTKHGWPKIPPSHGWGPVTLHLSSIIFCGKNLSGGLHVGPESCRSGRG